MPARSEAQRRYLNAHFGHAWTKEHGFDNKGKLPEHVRKGKAVKKNQGGELAVKTSESHRGDGGMKPQSMAAQGEIAGETGSHAHHHKQATHHMKKARHHLEQLEAHLHHAGKAHRKRGKKAAHHTKHRGHHKARGHEVPRGVGHY